MDKAKIENEKETVFFEDETVYELGKTKYIVKSHFQEEGEDIISKITRMIKTDIQNTAIQSL